MSYALIDNATLTAVQRVTGLAPTRSADNLDIDLVALENFLQATLFYDELIVVDDYKNEFKEQRKKQFSSARFISPSDFNIPHISNLAKSHAERVHPQIEAGNLVNEEYLELFKKLKTQMICTWDVSSSVYYLTLKALGRMGDIETTKFSRLAASIFSEFTDASNSNGKPFRKVTLVDQYGDLIEDGYSVPHAKSYNGETGGMTSSLKVFIASLNWLVNRTAFYTLLADYLKADTFLYPTRQSFQPYYLQKFLSINSNYSRDIVENLSSSIRKDFVAVKRKDHTFASSLSLPLFSAWVVDQVGDPRHILEKLHSIREEEHIKNARHKLREISNLLNEEGLEKANKERLKLENELKDVSIKLRAKYSIGTAQGIPVGNLIRVFNWLPTGLPNLPAINFEIPDYLGRIKKRKGFAFLYQDLSESLANVWSLGKIRDMLGSAVVYDLKESYNTKSEDPKYRKAVTDWKAPM